MGSLPTPTKFTEETRKKILQTLRVGASRRTAAHIAGIDPETLSRWMAKGKDAAEESRWHRFHQEVLEAEAHPRVRALGIIYNELTDDPKLAWKFIERREPGFEPPMPAAAPPSAPVVIRLTLADGTLPALGAGDIIEGEVVDEQDVPAEPDPAESAPHPSA